MLGRRRQPA